MKFLILNIDYPEFLAGHYAQHPGLAAKSYDEQMRLRIDTLFGVADFYSSNLRKLGHEAWDIHLNNEPMQKAWAREHGLQVSEAKWAFRVRNGVIPWASRMKNTDWRYEILAAQMEHYKPDVLLNHAMDGISTRFIKKIKRHARLVVGQHAATQLKEKENWRVYDLIISSFPPMVDWARAKGMAAELNRLGFEARINDLLQPSASRIPISFVGSLHKIHSSRIEWLEHLAAKFEIQVWAPDLHQLSATSPIRRTYRGPLWGREMYQVMRDSQITLNHHGNVPPFANNCRLYEATGSGALLMTDWKANLHEMFEPGQEVIAYRTNEECATLLQHYLDHAAERASVAKAGQERTLKTHTYYQRMQELTEILKRYV